MISLADYKLQSRVISYLRKAYNGVLNAHHSCSVLCIAAHLFQVLRNALESRACNAQVFLIRVLSWRVPNQILFNPISHGRLKEVQHTSTNMTNLGMRCNGVINSPNKLVDSLLFLDDSFFLELVSLTGLV